jgi:hypothetical protein
MARTTLIIDKHVLADLKELAAARGQTVFALADGFLREGIERARATEKPPSLPQSINMGRALVDVADRNALYDVFDRESGFPESIKPPRS